MRASLSSVALLVTGLAVLLAAVTIAPAAPKGPADFALTGGKGSPGPVTFSHEKHMAKVEKCNACHVKVFKMKKGTSGEITMAKINAGEQCGVCHTGKASPLAGGTVVFAANDKANCEKCHKK